VKTRHAARVILTMVGLGLVGAWAMAQDGAVEPVRPQRVPLARPKPVGPSGGAQVAAPAHTAGNAQNDFDLKNGRTPDGPVSFDFKGVELTKVIEQIARITGRNFDIDPSIGAVPVTLITHDEIPPELAYQVLESILSTRGFHLVELLDGHLIKVAKVNELLDKSPFGEGTVPLPDRYDTYETHIVRVEYADAGELSTILQNLGSSTCRTFAYAPTNMLIITDTTDGLRRIFSFLEKVDIPGFETDMEIFTLEYTRAETLAAQIEQVLVSDGPGAAPSKPTPTRPVRPTRRPSVPGRTAPVTVGSREEILRIVPDERLNALIVLATDGMMERVRDLVVTLDTPTPYEANNLHVYELLNADAEQVEAALNSLVGTTPRKAAQQGGAAGAEIQPFEKEVKITRYEQTNALLILASPQDYKLIREIIAQLDVPTRQVHIEAIILEVSITDNYTLNIETAAFQGDTHGVVALNNVIKLANMLTQGPLSVAGAGMTAGYLDGTTNVVIPGLDGGLIPMTIPNVPLLITALENMTDIDVLSQPSLTTRNNEQASIVVGQEVPVPNMRSGYSYSQQSQPTTPYGGLTTSSRGISREDVGVKMTVKPHINEGDYVSTEIEIEVSQPIVSDVGITADELGPTFKKSQITNNVVVKDGSTAVIGGLISETTDHSRRQAPLLGDIPLIGWVFRSKGDARRKNNLVVLLTPHIVKESAELERLTAYRMDEFREANLDVLFEEGFIRKIKKRRYMRTKYRPTTERGLTFDAETGFGRGDVER